MMNIDIKKEVLNLRHVVSIEARKEQLELILRQCFKDIEINVSSYHFNDGSGHSDVIVAEFNNMEDAIKAKLLMGLNYEIGTKKATLVIPTHSWY